MSVSCECCMLSGRGLCDGPISRPEKSYRLRCVSLCVIWKFQVRRPWPPLGCSVRDKTFCRVMRWLINNQLEGIRKEEVVTQISEAFWSNWRKRCQYLKCGLNSVPSECEEVVLWSNWKRSLIIRRQQEVSNRSDIALAKCLKRM